MQVKRELWELHTVYKEKSYLPSIAAFIAEDKCGHGLVSTSSLNLRENYRIIEICQKGDGLMKFSYDKKNLIK